MWKKRCCSDLRQSHPPFTWGGWWSRKICAFLFLRKWSMTVSCCLDAFIQEGKTVFFLWKSGLFSEKANVFQMDNFFFAVQSNVFVFKKNPWWQNSSAEIPTRMTWRTNILHWRNGAMQQCVNLSESNCRDAWNAQWNCHPIVSVLLDGALKPRYFTCDDGMEKRYCSKKWQSDSFWNGMGLQSTAQSHVCICRSLSCTFGKTHRGAVLFLICTLFWHRNQQRALFGIAERRSPYRSILRRGRTRMCDHGTANQFWQFSFLEWSQAVYSCLPVWRNLKFLLCAGCHQTHQVFCRRSSYDSMSVLWGRLTKWDETWTCLLGNVCRMQKNWCVNTLLGMNLGNQTQTPNSCIWNCIWHWNISQQKLHFNSTHTCTALHWETAIHSPVPVHMSHRSVFEILANFFVVWLNTNNHCCENKHRLHFELPVWSQSQLIISKTFAGCLLENLCYKQWMNSELIESFEKHRQHFAVQISEARSWTIDWLYRHKFVITSQCMYQRRDRGQLIESMDKNCLCFTVHISGAGSWSIDWIYRQKCVNISQYKYQRRDRGQSVTRDIQKLKITPCFVFAVKLSKRNAHCTTITRKIDVCSVEKTWNVRLGIFDCEEDLLTLLAKFVATANLPWFIWHNFFSCGPAFFTTSSSSSGLRLLCWTSCWNSFEDHDHLITAKWKVNTVKCQKLQRLSNCLHWSDQSQRKHLRHSACKAVQLILQDLRSFDNSFPRPCCSKGAGHCFAIVSKKALWASTQTKLADHEYFFLFLSDEKSCATKMFATYWCRSCSYAWTRMCSHVPKWPLLLVIQKHTAHSVGEKRLQRLFASLNSWVVVSHAPHTTCELSELPAASPRDYYWSNNENVNWNRNFEKPVSCCHQGTHRIRDRIGLLVPPQIYSGMFCQSAPGFLGDGGNPRLDIGFLSYDAFGQAAVMVTNPEHLFSEKFDLIVKSSVESLQSVFPTSLLNEIKETDVRQVPGENNTLQNVQVWICVKKPENSRFLLIINWTLALNFIVSSSWNCDNFCQSCCLQKTTQHPAAAVTFVCQIPIQCVETLLLPCKLFLHSQW